MSCKHGNWTGCEECAAEDAAWKEAYESGKADGRKETQQPPYEERLRDEFAMAAMQGLVSHSGSYGVTNGPLDLSERAYQIADAMLQARKQGGE